MVFILLFPHLVMVVHFPKRTNKYGMVAGFTVALLLRVLSGEPVLKYNAVLKFAGYVDPVYDEDVSSNKQSDKTSPLHSFSYYLD